MGAEQAVRLDKWLWAARFHKTRSLAKQAIESGHVRCEGERCKVSKDVKPGMHLRLRQGREEVEILVVALSDQRRGAPEARLLYQETPDSLQQREQRALERRLANSMVSEQRPTKKQRRDIRRFKDAWSA